MGKNVLILGGSYFIGRSIAALLSGRGYRVTVLNRGTRPPASSEWEQVVCDRGDADGMKNALRGRRFDGIVDVSWRDIGWVENLCAAACFEGVKKLVFLSSSAVYDAEHLIAPFQEDDPLRENPYWTSYGAGKIAAEAYYWKFFESRETQLIILRPPYVYGEFNYAQRESFVFHRLLEGKPVVVPASNPRLQFLYAGDLADIVRFFLEQQGRGTAVYNVGNAEAVTAADWVSLCAKAAGLPARVAFFDEAAEGRSAREFFPFFAYDNVLDVYRFRRLYSRETPMEEGLGRAYRWFLKHREEIAFKPEVERNLDEILRTRSRWSSGQE